MAWSGHLPVLDADRNVLQLVSAERAQSLIGSGRVVPVGTRTRVRALMGDQRLGGLNARLPGRICKTRAGGFNFVTPAKGGPVPCETFAKCENLQPRRNFVGMEAGMAELELAVRVISAINEDQTPEPEDLNELRRIAPSPAHFPPDDLAFDVIEQAIQWRDFLRKRPICSRNSTRTCCKANGGAAATPSATSEHYWGC